ncbi:hypothetical protein Ciccas_012213 [Cichlidogyrus casuarinus]|uniref:Tr-type G domain-containing protein n=1 Tax=Cichlidogyrus casuarinus TaxID=1844966 RepID=A0ABD2PP50_9PLAT
MDDLSLFFAEEPTESESIRRTHSKKQNALNRLSCFYPNSEYENESKSPKRLIRTHNSISLGNIADNMPEFLPPEVEEGNIEYKRKLVKPTPERFEHLVTQMKWRLTEGSGEAIYRLGVDDNGSVTGLSPADMAASLRTLQRMAIRLNATLQPLRQRVIFEHEVQPDSKMQNFKKAVELLVTQLPATNKGNPDLCVAVLGGLEAGKSTLVGVLSQGERDNGRGKARLNLFRHLHEFRTGRTSSSSSEVLGFSADRKIVNYETRNDGSIDHKCADEVVRRSEYLITLLDLAGHPRYQKTTIAGLVQSKPVHVVLVVSANSAEFQELMQPSSNSQLCTQDHARLALLLGTSISVVVTKSDLVTPERLHVVCEQLLNQLERTFNSVPRRYKRHVA